MPKEYFEKLKDPRWQKKRLEILKREDFTCEVCKSKERTLHVHHKIYVYGRDPWDYVDTNFSVLCDTCHEFEEMYKTEFNGLVHDLLLMGNNYQQLYIHLSEILNPIKPK